MAHTVPVFSCTEALTTAQRNAIAHRIYLNECNGKKACLVDWNPGEDFPSLGIGHFIWYPNRIDPGFVESFPLLIEFMQQQSIELPEWIAELDPFDAPWPDRETFEKQRDDANITQLRSFLERHQSVQIAFMQQRMRHSLNDILAYIEPTQRLRVERNISLLCRSIAGQYTLIDYVNFKGEGLAAGERVQGRGWGLTQVLLEMNAVDSEADATDQFAAAAEKVLTRRAMNASNPIEAQRWLPGWKKRIQTYTTFAP